MNRLDRLTAILTQLQSKRLLKASEIAERFDVSLRTIYRDMRALEEAGVPIVGEAGQGYALVEGYRLPPVMFTKEEALSFLVAGKIFEKVTDKESGNHFQSALFKIKSVLRHNEKDILENMSSQVAVLKRNTLHQNGKEQVLQKILDCLSDHSLLQVNYTTFEKEEITIRILEPIGVYFSFEQWYLIAYCRLRKDYRTFRVDRINDLKIIGGKFEGQHPSLHDYLEKIEKEANLTKIVIEIPRYKLKYLQQQKYGQGFLMQENHGDRVRLTFMTSSLEGFARWIIMMADFITVLQPPALKARMKDLLETMLSRITDPVPESLNDA